MQHKRRDPKWWSAWLLRFLLGGLLVLEPYLPLCSGGHQIAQLTIALCMYGGGVGWLRRHRGALVNEEYEREQAEERLHTARPSRRDPARSGHDSWDNTGLPWHSNGHDTDTRGRR